MVDTSEGCVHRQLFLLQMNNVTWNEGATMIDPNIFDDIARKVCDAIPSGAKNLQKEVEKNIKAVMQGAFAKLDLVTREEFDVQVKVLSRTRAKLDELSEQITKYEQAGCQHAEKKAHKTKEKHAGQDKNKTKYEDHDDSKT